MVKCGFPDDEPHNHGDICKGTESPNLKHNNNSNLINNYIKDFNILCMVDD